MDADHPEHQKSVEIAETTPEDIPELSKVLQVGWLLAYANEEIGLTEEIVKAHTDMFNDPDKQQWQVKNLNSAHLKKWTARVDGKIVGFADVHLEQNRLLGLYVLTEHHGSGVAQELTDVALGALDDTRPMHVNVAAYNKRAIRFYEKQGFVFDHDGKAHDVGGVEMPTSEMVRHVKKPRRS